MERKWWTLLAVCVATFMLLMDIAIVNVALPSIERELHAGLTKLQWVIDAYTLMLSALILTAGSLADRLGRRIVFALGVVVFTIASLLCGLAPSATLLDVARGLQGIGGAAMFATSLALLGMREVRDPDTRGLDPAGLVTSSAALFLLVFGLLRGNEEGWGSALIVGSLVSAAVLLAVFVALAGRQARPMPDLSPFRRPAFVG